MNRLQLLFPCSHISRAIRVQKRPVTCYRLLNKSFSTTTCRKFAITSILRRTEESPPPPPAETDLDQDDPSIRELFIGQ